MSNWVSICIEYGNEPQTYLSEQSYSEEKIRYQQNVKAKPRKRFHSFFMALAVIPVIFYLESENPTETILYEHIRDASCVSPECIRTSSELLQDIDFEIDPCDDFYEFTCGNWDTNHSKSASLNYMDRETRVGNKILLSVRDFLEAKAAVNESKIITQSRIMYHSCMKSEQIKQVGKQTILEYLNKFHLPKLPSVLIKSGENETFSYKFDWVQSIAEIKKILGIDIVFGFDIITDLKNVSQKGIKLGKPNQDTLLIMSASNSIAHNVNNEAIEKQRLAEIYERNIQLLYPNFDQNLNDAFDMFWKMDKAIAAAPFRNLNSQKWDNLNDFEKLIGNSGGIMQKYLKTIFNDVSIDGNNQNIFANFDDIKHLRSIFKYFSEKSEEELELYIWLRVLDELATRVFADSENRAEKTLHCTSVVQNFMPMIATYGILTPDFETVTRPKVSEMLENIRSVFHEMIKQAEWVDRTTKTMIIEKSKAMKVDIGYPEWLLNENKLQEYYGALNLNETTFLKNIISTLQNEMNIKLKSLNSTEDMGWELKPLTVNANHNRARNAITIPIAILQYPFYNLGMEALNYGAIGAIIGHELMHGFDNGGIQFDKYGNWDHEWMDGKMVKIFEQRSDCFVGQYNNSFLPEINSYVNGKATLDENISDNHGLQQAFHAYKMHVAKHGEERKLPLFDRFTHEQLFFISYGNRYCRKDTKEALEFTVNYDSHSPNRFRVNNVVANSKEFRRAFKCGATSKMVSKNTCSLW